MTETIVPENFICSECHEMVQFSFGTWECDCQFMDEDDLGDQPLPFSWSPRICAGCEQPITELGTVGKMPDGEPAYFCAQCTAFAEAAGDPSGPLAPESDVQEEDSSPDPNIPMM